ncbi:MAG: ABC transporter permease [Clostridiales bacterium]|jgi:putative ABC transport system permease protein|nr:ABC transporter permease [Clostridiales bacterium]
MNILNKVTIKLLVKNKVRTLVTIIGIILSVAMFTAVTTSISSFQNFLKEVIIAEEGYWHGAVYNLNNTGIEKIRNNSDVEKIALIQNIGYVQLEKYNNENKPFLFIGGIDSSFVDIIPIYFKDGRLPESSDEIILPAHLLTNGGVRYNVGDILELDVGKVMINGIPLTQQDTFAFGNSFKMEFTKGMHRTFKVVGIYERPDFEYYSAPGYTALTLSDGSKEYNSDVYFVYNSPKYVSSYLDNNFKENNTRIHSDLLRVMGISDDNAFNSVLYSLGAILIILIMVGSISLIYNAFSISVSERTKQYGLLTSVGATKRQLMRSILTEASLLNVIGIPIGVLAGMAGIGITFMLCEDLFKSFLNISSGLVLKLHVSWEALVIALLISIVTVLISAYIPAKRAMKVSVIDAIRQTQDIKIDARKVRTSKLSYKLFGIEGMIATKNFKRNKKKYRATVISLFISVVLFISASSFSVYLTEGVRSVVSVSEYDIAYSLSADDTQNMSIDDIYKKLSSIDGISKSGYTLVTYQRVLVPTNLVNKKYIDYRKQKLGNDSFDANNSDLFEFDALLYFINDDLYKEFITANNLDINKFMESDLPEASVIDFVKKYDGKYHTFNVLTESSMEVLLAQQKEGEEYDSLNESSYEENILDNEAYDLKSVKIGAVVESKPFVVDINTDGLTFLYPYSKLNAVLGNGDYDETHSAVYFKAEDHKAVYEKMSNVIMENGLNSSNLYDYADRVESQRALITVLNVFSYGFIVLISLIAAANVFNTISTNISLRRREMAMLKSIGMTQKGFSKMMNFECLLYGVKGLIYGLPVSFVITYWIFKSISNGWETNFFIPWQNVAIAVGSVFAVVFATMIYSMQKIKKDNPIDALKNENL